MEAPLDNHPAVAPGPAPERLIVAMTGVEGARYGIGLLEALRGTAVESHLVMCACARQAIRAETGRDPDLIRKLASRSYHPYNQAAKISSGSFLTKGMVIAPCSVRSLSAIVNGYATTLVARAADVTLKERRPLVLLVNESPLSPIQMENLRRAATVPGVVVSWPGQQADDEVVDGLLARFAIPRVPLQEGSAGTRPDEARRGPSRSTRSLGSHYPRERLAVERSPGDTEGHMSKVVGDRLPEQITRAFDGQDLGSKIGPAHLLVTTDEDGTPRPCMLSAGEVLATGDDRLRLILWTGSTTCRNLARGGPVLFCYVVGRDLYYVKGTPRALPPSASSKLERFEIQVHAVESDRHEGMPVTAGITFGIGDLDPAKVTAGWRRQLAALRE